MPKLLQVYANSIGLKVSDKPTEFPVNFFPTPEKYVVLHTGASEDSRQYDYYGLVVDFLRPILVKNNIEIMQIGSEKDVRVPHTINCLGKNTYRQAAFIVKRAEAYLGSDSAWSHVAGNFNKPIVSLYSINPPHIAAPYYAKNIITLEPDRNGDKPYFDSVESEKSINKIKPEVVANSLLGILGFDDKVKIETETIGEKYNNHQVDVIPDHFINPEKFQNKKICIRLDVEHRINESCHILNNFPAIIITSKGLPMFMLHKFRKNIRQIIFKINKETDIKDIEILKASGIPHQLVTDETGEDLSNLKLKYFDFNQIYSIIDRTPQNPEYYFMTNRVFVAKNGAYPSLAHLKENNKIISGPMPIGHYFNNQDFLESLDNYYITKNKTIWDEQKKQ